MALSPTLKFEDQVDGDHLPKVVYIASINSRWIDALTDGGPGVQDASPIVNPVTEIINPTARIVLKPDAGTIVRVRLGYDDGVGGPVTSPVINLFGRTNTDAFERLMNQNRDQDVTLTVNLTNDVTDGTFKYTTADIVLHSIDLVACNELLIGVKTALTVTSGIVTNSFLQVKLLN